GASCWRATASPAWRSGWRGEDGGRPVMRLLKPSLLASGRTIERHRHPAPYATIVLSGSYEEAGDAGRATAAAGEALLHAPFSCHRNRISAQRTRVLDLPLPFDARRWMPKAAIADP